MGMLRTGGRGYSRLVAWVGTLCFFLNKPFRGGTRLCDGVGFTPCQVSKHLPPRKMHFLVGKQGADCRVVHILTCVSPHNFSEPSLYLLGQIECMTEMRKREMGICPHALAWH